MLKDLVYAGTYRDKDISVIVILQSPLDYGLNANTMAFEVMVAAKSDSTVAPLLKDFTFYIIDEANLFYNVRNATYSSLRVDMIINPEESPHTQKRLILTEFMPEFLYQEMRVGFYYKPYNHIEMITLEI